jgi:hypothetical protein
MAESSVSLRELARRALTGQAQLRAARRSMACGQGVPLSHCLGNGTVGHLADGSEAAPWTPADEAVARNDMQAPEGCGRSGGGRSTAARLR